MCVCGGGGGGGHKHTIAPQSKKWGHIPPPPRFLRQCQNTHTHTHTHIHTHTHTETNTSTHTNQSKNFLLITSVYNLYIVTSCDFRNNSQPSICGFSNSLCACSNCESSNFDMVMMVRWLLSGIRCNKHFL